MTKKSLFATFSSRIILEMALYDLKEAGFTGSDISALIPHDESSRNLGIEKVSKSPEGSAAGAISGAILGGAFGWLIGIGLLTIPGLGSFVAAGPLVSTLAGVGAGGTVGGISGALIGLGFPEFEAKRYEGFVKEGKFLLAVHCNDADEEYRARMILEDSGGEHISVSSEAKADTSLYDYNEEIDTLVRKEKTIPNENPPYIF